MTDGEALGRPPFARVESLGPPQVGAEIVAAFERLAPLSDRLQRAHALAMRSIGLPASEPLHRAGVAIARDIDGGTGAGVAGGYHNGRHFLEVMLCALCLARAWGLDRDRSARVVTAALVHDFHHDGSRGASSPFRLETLAAARARPYLRAADVAPLECDRLTTLILATEPRTGVPFARECRRFHAAAATKPDAARVPAPLGRLIAEPELAFEAVLLAEADVLPSIGLTTDHAMRVQDSLAAEWNEPMDARDKLAFVEKVGPEITIARFFAPNIEALRAACLERLAGDDRRGPIR